MEKPNLPHRMYLVLGDYSGDGHKQFDKILVAANKTVEEIQQSYKDSCKLTGVSFDLNDNFTGLKRNFEEMLKYEISTTYESGLHIHLETCEALSAHGMQIPHYILNGMSDEKEDFTKLWFQFVTLSLKDLQYEVVEEDIPSINGCGNLPVQFGYGLYFG